MLCTLKQDFIINICTVKIIWLIECNLMAFEYLNLQENKIWKLFYFFLTFYLKHLIPNQNKQIFV